mmetsp:Transcript_20658/g.52615  ORF Transcript_20658/g.52615 Transcript_20658/m.52615 type:complete len:287 (-) Transcript_20658:3660-4520(-)
MMRFLTKRPRQEEGPSDCADEVVLAAKSAKTDDAVTASPPAAVASLLSHLSDPGWTDALQRETQKAYFVELANKVAAERNSKTVFPPENQVFSAFNLTPLDDVRVVILGQDPYHGRGQAHGLAFSVAHGIAVPPSLKNIYTELEQDIAGFRRPSHGNLEGWARGGVLMFNATLTVRMSEANSHEKYGWQTFTDAVIRVLNAREMPTVFILWGGFAQKKGKMINRSRHYVIETAHPSPLSVTKFRGCKCFSQVCFIPCSYNIRIACIVNCFHPHELLWAWHRRMRSW